MPRPVHFEFSADDPDRAARFYGDVFGWKVQKAPDTGIDYWLIATGEGDEPGINGGMARRGQGPAATTNTIAVPSLDEAMEAVTNAGGTLTTEKMAVAGVGWLAYATDTEGNAFGMMQPDENAGR
jgi:predicted enzyme related to lactoylglutathione lyase